MTPSKPSRLPKTPAPNTIPLGIRASMYEFGGTNTQALTLFLNHPQPLSGHAAEPRAWTETAQAARLNRLLPGPLEQRSAEPCSRSYWDL